MSREQRVLLAPLASRVELIFVFLVLKKHWRSISLFHPVLVMSLGQMLAILEGE